MADASAGSMPAARQGLLRPLHTLLGVMAAVVSLWWAALLAIPAALLASIGDGRIANQIGRLGARLILRTCAVNLEIRGAAMLERAGPSIIVANHNGLFDIFALAAWLPGDFRFVAKKEVLRIPVIGPAIRRAGHVVVDRAGGMAIRSALDLAARGTSIVVFAEGHRFGDGAIHDFKRGAAWIALKSGLPCVPLAIGGGADVFPRGTWYARVGRTITLTFGAPLAADKVDGAQALTGRLESAVRGLSHSWPPPPPNVARQRQKLAALPRRATATIGTKIHAGGRQTQDITGEAFSGARGGT